jgi:primosomal protein N' (replication factor Y)
MASPAYVEVAFPIPLNKTFHYRAAEGKIGCRVLAPFGPKKNLVGYVVGLMSEKPSFLTKEILRWLDTEPFFDAKLLELARWVADRYLCSLGEALACVVPPALSAPKRLKGEGRGEKGETDVSLLPSRLIPLPSGIKLTAEQTRALSPLLAAVEAKEFRTFLIRGITDSGKTEIYLRAIDQVLDQGRQALYLLPEIALTPPFLDQLQNRYGAEHVGLWHSGLSGGKRFRTWTAARKGEIQVLLGARSAVFAPFPKLGLIVLDEEHEGSYKQEDRPRYHTRDVALKRAELSSAVLVMGSATPSLESYWKAKQGTYVLLELTSRVEQRSLPAVELIDRRPHAERISDRASKRANHGESEASTHPRTRSLAYSHSVFSEPLKLAIEQRLARREQIMLFVNRRGFTPFLRCSKCGWVSRCDRCSTTMTVHHGEVPYLQCHGCSKRTPIVIQCPSCRTMRLHQYGIGTQKVEEELKKLFPFVKVARLDRDIAGQRKMYEKIYSSFIKGELDVLVGTQMIAKGFNFPHVTLVGVVDADVSLHLPDFRSAERTFDLLTQVAGRTGRGDAKGKVLVQTHHPDHYALQAAQEHDYLRFYEQEIGDRERMKYPPFCRLINIVLRAAKEPAAQKAAEDLGAELSARVQNVDVLGPAPAPYSRLRNQFRYQVLIKGADETLDACLRFLRGYRPAKAFMTVDVDPADLL